jgi:hypothetical protein
VSTGPDQHPGADAPRPLRTQPRPLAVHWLVDSAVAFLATIIVALFLGVGWLVVLIAAVVLGTVLAPMTHRADERAMATRRAA